MSRNLADCRPIQRPFACCRDATKPRGIMRTLKEKAPSAVSRRYLISQSTIFMLLVPKQSQAHHLYVISEGDQPLPKGYVNFARRLLTALRDSIEADLSTANETELRRKADPAKTLVKEWVVNWRDARQVSSEVSYKNITESLQLLGDFYLKKGQRARLPSELASLILRRLDAASAALPA